MSKDKETSLEDIFKSIKSSARGIYQKKFTVPRFSDIADTVVNLNYGITKENREQVKEIANVIKGQVQVDETDISLWTLGYINAFSHLIFLKIGRENDFINKPSILVFIFSEIFNISKGKAEKKYNELFKNFDQGKDGAYSAELDFKKSVHLRGSDHLEFWSLYITQGTFPLEDESMAMLSNNKKVILKKNKKKKK